MRMPLMPSTTMLLLTPTALGNSERQVVHVSLRKNVWSDGTPMRATFSTSAQATRSIIPPDASGTSGCHVTLMSPYSSVLRSLFWGGLPLEVFGNGKAAASPKDFPDLLGYHNLFGDSEIQLTAKDLLVLATTLPLMAGLTWFVTRTRMGTAMRACAQDPTAAALMGVDVDRVVSATFFIGGALAGVASVVWCLYNNSLGFQMGYRVGVDAFTAAVLGGIGNLPGAVLGGIAIGLIRAFSDQWIATAWTNVMVFAVLIGFLIFRPNGILGTRVREKV
jgi:branched-chain amino acid transport system permease protein